MEKRRKLPIITDNEELFFALVDEKGWLVIKQGKDLLTSTRILVIESKERAKLLIQVLDTWVKKHGVKI